MSKKNEKLKAYIDEVVNQQPEKIQDALKDITNNYRHLMAVRGYVKYYASRKARWPFTTDAEETEFKKTTTYKNLEKDKKAIFKKFAEQNKGYRLKANSKPRNLDKQIRYWNGNSIVRALGKDLETKAKSQLAKKRYPDSPTDEALESFKQWLSSVYLTATVNEKTRKRPPYATPGLSSHGRIQALDFLVYKGDKQVTWPDTATATTKWDKPGWTEKLKTAIESVSKDWEGPLKAPYEPWHYTYTGK